MASELDTLGAIEAHGDLNPVQKTRLQQLRGAGQSGNPFGIESTGLNPTSSTPQANNQQADDRLAQGQAAVKSQADQANAAFQNLYGQNKQSVTDFLAKSQADTGNAISGASATFQLPQQQRMVQGLNSRISELKNNTTNEGAGGFASSGQVDAAINSRYQPQLTAAQANLNTSADLAQRQVQLMMQPDQQYGTLLAKNIETGMSALTETQRQAMEGVLGSLNAGMQLSQTELTTANELAKQVLANSGLAQVANIQQQTEIQKQQIANAGALAAAQAQAQGYVGQQEEANRFKDLTAGHTLYNTVTNQQFRAS